MSMRELRADPLLSTTTIIVRAAQVIVGLAAAVTAIAGLGVAGFAGPVQAELVTEHPGITVPEVMGLGAFILLASGLCVLAFLFLQKLAAILRTVREGDPLTEDNADRLSAMGWIAVALQAVGVVLMIAAAHVRDLFGAPDRDMGINLSGLLLILLLFVLARVFRAGAAMRAELEGTV